MKCGLMDFLRGRQGLGSNWVDPYRCQDAFPSLVEPYRATGGYRGSVQGHFPYFPDFLKKKKSYFVYKKMFVPLKNAKKDAVSLGADCRLNSEF